MTKIRCGDSLGADINQVIAWKIFTPDQKRGETLVMYFSGAGDTFHVSKNLVGCQAFAHLHKLLLDQFAIDLAGEKNLLCEDDDSSEQDEPFKLHF